MKQAPAIASALAVAALWLAAPARAQTQVQATGEGEELAVAERQPLASRSLLLDLHRLPDGRFLAVGERGHILSSGDGREWTQAAYVPTRSTLTAVTGSGSTLWAAGHDTVILRSEDGGERWTLLNFEPDRGQPIMDLYFRDADTGFAVGAYGLFMKTEDGGETWEEFFVSPDDWHLNGIEDLGDGRLVISGEKGFGYVSDDGGETWVVIELPYRGSMFGTTLADGCVIAYGLRGHVQRSCDRGESWEELSTPVENSLAGAASRDGETVFVGNNGQVLVLEQDGRMRAEQHPSGVDFAAVVPLGGGQWLIVGEGGAHRFPAGAEG